MKNLIQRDLQHVWHPCSHMKDFEQHPPLLIHRAEGSYLYSDRGPIIDAISSWWCKSLGHGYPPILDAIQTQLHRFEHVIGAGTTHHLMVELAEQLTEITGLQHVFFASDGSSAVEIAMKLALQSASQQGHPEKTHFISLKNSYHGETLATLSVSDLGRNTPFSSSIMCHVLQSVPYVTHLNEPTWSDCSAYWALAEAELERIKPHVCAVLVEPIVQGAGGMCFYSADFLRRLALWAKKNNIYLIADEIMTGLCRTGQWLASNHAAIRADMICLSKGLTAGTIPLSCVMIDKAIYEQFYHEAHEGKSFLHSHTYSGNSLAISAAIATLKILRAEQMNQRAEALGQCMQQHFLSIAEKTGVLHNVRSIGAIVAGELESNGNPRIGYQLQQAAIQRGALLRPLGNTLYWMPPLTCDEQTIEKLAIITLHSINAIFSRKGVLP